MTIIYLVSVTQHSDWRFTHVPRKVITLLNVAPSAPLPLALAPPKLSVPLEVPGAPGAADLVLVLGAGRSGTTETWSRTQPLLRPPSHSAALDQAASPLCPSPPPAVAGRCRVYPPSCGASLRHFLVVCCLSLWWEVVAAPVWLRPVFWRRDIRPPERVKDSHQ